MADFKSAEEYAAFLNSEGQKPEQGSASHATFRSADEYAAFLNSQTLRPESPPTPPRGIVGNIGAGLAHGTLGLGEAAGTVMQYLGGKTGIEPLESAGKATHQYFEGVRKPYESTADIEGSVFDNPKLLLSPSWWAYNVADTAPSIASSMIPGMGAMKAIKIGGTALKWTPQLASRLARIGAAASGGVAGGVQEGASTYQEVLQRGGTKEQAERAMELMSLASAGLNALSMDRLLRPGKFLSARSFLLKGGTESLTEYAEEPAEVLIKRGLLSEEQFPVSEAYKQLKQGLNVVGPSFLMGGVSGIGANIAGNEEAPRTEQQTLNVLPQHFFEETRKNLDGGTVSMSDMADFRSTYAQREDADPDSIAHLDAFIAAYQERQNSTPQGIIQDVQIKGLDPDEANKEIIDRISSLPFPFLSSAPESNITEWQRLMRPAKLDQIIDSWKRRFPESEAPAGEVRRGLAVPTGNYITPVEEVDFEEAPSETLLNSAISPTEEPGPPPSSAPTLLDEQAHGAATSHLNELPQPTQAQKEAGNYKMGHVNVQGLDISIENPKGSTRSGVNSSGKKWESKMFAHYGYIKGTVGKDKDHIDTFIGENPQSDQVYVVNQVKPETGKFDEHKVMLGTDSEEEARTLYLANYEKGWKGLGSIVPMSMDDFKTWIKEGNTKAPAKVAPEAKAAPVPSLYAHVLRNGGLSPDAIRATGIDLKEDVQQAGLFGLMRKNGQSPDALADELIGSGIIPPAPENMTADQYLMNLLQDERKGLAVTIDQIQREADNDYERTIEEHGRRYPDEPEESTRGIAEEADRTAREIVAGIEGQEALELVTDEDFVSEDDYLLNPQKYLEEKANEEVSSPPARASNELFDTSESFALSGAQPVKQNTFVPPEKRPERLIESERQDAAEIGERLKGRPTKETIQDFGEKVGGARKDLADKGTPKLKSRPKAEDSEPAWGKRYKAVESVKRPGVWAIVDVKEQFARFTDHSGQTFASQEEAEKAIPLYAVARQFSTYQESGGGWSIYKRVGERKRFKMVNQNFPSREDAMKYMAVHAEELLNTKTSFGEEILPVPDTVTRKGTERRTGPATPEMFMETFAPKAIEFGNWNNQEERQLVMDHAYDGLLDLADALNLPPKALMLNGDLAIAFGARGQGLVGAKAHYERDYGIINLTKMKGAGSLAHEWLHAFDHYLGRLDTKAKSEKITNKRGDLVYPASAISGPDLLSHGASLKSQLRPELKDAYKDIIDTIYSKAEQYVEDTQKADKFVATARENLQDYLNRIRTGLQRDESQWRKNRFGKPATPDQIAEFDRLSNILTEGGDLETKFVRSDKSRNMFGGRHTNDTLEALNALLKEVRNRQGFNAERTGDLDHLRSAMGLYAARLKMFEDAKAGTEKTKKAPTNFAIEAKKMDQARAGNYWSEPHEMAARAFASYVEDKIAQAGGQSDFLVYHAHGGILLPMIDGFVARPYPEGTERTAINEAFDRFIEALETTETEKGVALREKGLQYGHEEVQTREGIRDKGPSRRLSGTLLPQQPEVVTERVGSFKAGVSKVFSAEDAAQVAHHFTKDPQENAVVIITGENDKLIAVHRYSRGLSNAALVSPSDVIGQALNTEGAKGIWFAHNHPSGVPEFSQEDIGLETKIRKAAEGSDIEVKGAIVVTPEVYAEQSSQGIIVPGKKTETIPVVERRFAQGPKNLPVITGPTEVLPHLKKIIPEGGLLFLDTRSQIVDGLVIPSFEKLKGEYQTAIFKTAEKRNACRVIAYAPHRTMSKEEAGNLASFTDAANFDLLDIIHGDGQSWAGSEGMTGIKWGAGERPFFRLASDLSTHSFRLTFPNKAKHDVPRVEAFIKPVKDRLPNIGTVKVLSSWREVPVGLLYQIKSVEGIFSVYDPSTDTTYLFAEAINDAQSARVVLLHEVIGHRGIEAILTDVQKHLVFKQLAEAYKDTEKGKQIIKDYGFDLTKQADQDTFSRELIAHLAESGDKPSLWKRIVATIKMALRRFVDLKYSDVDIRGLIAKSWKWGEGQRQTGAVQSEGTPGLYRKSQEEEAHRLGRKLQAEAQNWKRALSDYYNGKLKSDLLPVSSTPQPLIKLGSPDYPVTITQRKLADAIEKHSLTKDMLEQLPHSMATPVMVFDSTTNPGRSLVLATELTDSNGDPVVVPVYVDVVQSGRRVNAIGSIYGKEKAVSWFRAQIDAGRLRYVDKEKASQWSRSGGLQLPKEATTQGPSSGSHTVRGRAYSRILTEKDIVKPILPEKIEGPYFKKQDITAGLPPELARFLNKARSDTSRLGDAPTETPPPPLDADPEKTRTWLSQQWTAAFNTIIKGPKSDDLSLTAKILQSPEYWDHPVLSKIVRLFVRNRSELYHELFWGLDNPTEGDAAVTEATRALKKADRKKYDQLKWAIDYGDTEWRRDKRKPLEEQMAVYEDFLKAKGLGDDVLQVWKLHRRSYDKALDLMTAQLRQLTESLEEKAKGQLFTPQDKTTLENLRMALASMEEWRGFYAPRIREPGSYVMQASRIRKERIVTKPFSFDRTDSKNEYHFSIRPKSLFEDWITATSETAGHYGLPSTEGVNYVMGKDKGTGQYLLQSIRFKKDVFDGEAKAASWWNSNRDTIDAEREFIREHGGKWKMNRRAEELKAQGWTVKPVDKIERLGEDIYQNLKVVDMAQAIDQALRNLREGAQGPEAAQIAVGLNEEIIELVSNMIKARGYRSTMIHRSEGQGVVRGYIEDPMERFIRYTNSVSGGISKAKVAQMAMNELLGEYVDGKRVGGIDEVKEARAYKAAQDYIKEQLRNIEPIDRAIGIAKSIASFKYLGFNVRSLAVNLTAIATTAPAAIHEYAAGGKTGFIKINAALTRAGKDYAKFMAGRKLDAESQAICDAIKKEGWDDAQYVRDATGLLQKSREQIWSKAMTGAMYGFGVTEQWNRGTTILAAYRVAKGQGKTSEEALELAKQASDKAHGIYGKATLPSWAQGPGLGRIGQMMYVYSKFGHNYVQMLYELGFKKHNIAAMAWALAAPMVLAGAAGAPFKKEIFWIIGGILHALGLTDKDPEKWVWDTIRRYLGGTAEVAGRHGLTGLVGVDISSSVSVGMGVPTGFADLAGAIGGVGEDIQQANRFLKTGQPGRAIEKMLPRAGENIARAAREARTGVVTQRGNRVWDESGRPLHRGVGGIVARGLGFRPSREAVLSERVQEAKATEESFKERRDAIYEEYRAFRSDPNRSDERRRKIYARIGRYNKDVKDSGLPKGEVPRIDFISLRRQATGMAKPTKREKARVSP